MSESQITNSQPDYCLLQSSFLKHQHTQDGLKYSVKFTDGKMFTEKPGGPDYSKNTWTLALGRVGEQEVEERWSSISNCLTHPESKKCICALC